MLNEWSVNLLQLNVVVLVLHPTLPLNVPVISEAHTANLIIQRHSQTLYMITNSLLLILQLCSLQWQKAMIKEEMLALCVCVCWFDVAQVCTCMHIWMKTNKCAFAVFFQSQPHQLAAPLSASFRVKCLIVKHESRFQGLLKWFFAVQHRDPIFGLKTHSRKEKSTFILEHISLLTELFRAWRLQHHREETEVNWVRWLWLGYHEVSRERWGVRKSKTPSKSLCCSAESLSDKIWVKVRIVIIAEEQTVFPYPIIRALWMPLWGRLGVSGVGMEWKNVHFSFQQGAVELQPCRCVCVCVCKGEAYSLWWVFPSQPHSWACQCTSSTL